ncbi:MAG: uracil-DNA glycosylase [Planctomycetes bacterium]|nr:uracil-DNA glycosylase [Planctomycetota bacterium]
MSEGSRDRRRRAVLQHLGEAADAYGGDLPIAVPAPAPARRAAAAARPAPAPAAAAMQGQPPADRATALAALRAEALPCTRCKLHKTRTQVVFGDGNPAARVLFVGEAPGQSEDEQGLPFVGRAGQLLTRIIEGGMGLTRRDVYIANINKCRPPNNREPEPDEVAACLPYLQAQIAILRPEVIVALGKVAAWNLLGIHEAMKHLRGRELSHGGIPVVVTWHPAYLLRNPAAKADTWEDIKRVNRMLGLAEDPRRQVPD